LQHYRCSLFALTYLLVAALPWLWIYFAPLRLELLLAIPFLILVWSVPACKEISQGLPSASASLLTVFYLGIPVCLLADFANRPHDHLWLILSAVWAGDGAALFIGRAWGRHRVTPRLSPNKSLEGYAAGIAAAVVTSLLVGGWLLPQRSSAFLILAGVVIGLSGILGDLFESLIKRGAKVKDSSDLLPGHGGLLDRIDSLLFALPAYYFLLLLAEAAL
jgi:phosphatidate cytidylyltransferase